jgi:hypothetical protein
VVNRRQLLIGAAPAVAALALWPAASLRGQGPQAASSPARRLAGILRNPASAARVGFIYLQQHPAEARLARLLDGLVGDWHDAGSWLDRAGPGELRSRLREQIRTDFAARRTVRVQGWVLAQSEARLSGLAALIAGGVTAC